MSKEQNKRKQMIKSTISRELSYSGPLPLPGHLQQYESICPGAADRIIKQAESQTEHRQFLEKAVVASNIFSEKLGMILNFIISSGIVIGGFFIVISNHGTSGYIAILGTPILSSGLVLGTKYMDRRKIDSPKS